jgi:predicted RNase H-like HicB family nuclease
MKYLVVFERAPENYAAYVPDLPGCIATAATRTKVELLIKEGIHIYLDELRQEGKPIPEPTATAELVES